MPWLIFWHGFVHWTGGDYGAPAYGYFEPYDWVSGILGLGVLGIFLTNFRKYNCKKKWCWRIGHHEFTDPTDGVTRLLCWKHHPDVVHKHLTDEVIDLIQAKRRRERMAKGPVEDRSKEAPR